MGDAYHRLGTEQFKVSFSSWKVVRAHLTVPRPPKDYNGIIRPIIGTYIMSSSILGIRNYLWHI